MLLQPDTEIVPGIGKLGVAGEVHQLAGIPAHVIKFLGGALAEGQVVKSPEAGLVLNVYEQLPRGGGVHLAKRDVARANLAVRITRRPAAGFVIPDVQVFLGADGPAGITLASLAAPVVAMKAAE